MGLTCDCVKDYWKMAKKIQEWHKEVIARNCKPFTPAHSTSNTTQVIELSEAPEAFRWASPYDGKSHSVVPAFSAGMRTIDMMLLVSGYAHEFGGDYAICLQQKSHDAEVKFNIWCLNPGVAFRDLREQCRSVILTSGALGAAAARTACMSHVTSLHVTRHKLAFLPHI